MTDAPKPLTADEVADLKTAYVGATGEDEEIVLSLIATIEQQAEQIERLRTTLSGIRIMSLDPAIQNEAFSALAATEPKP